MPDLLTTREVAGVLRISLSSVLRMVKDGALPVAQKLPGKTGAYLFAVEGDEVVELDRQP